MTSAEIPGSLLQSFFERATKVLDALDLSSHHDLSGNETTAATGSDATQSNNGTETEPETTTSGPESTVTSARSGLSQHRLAILQVQQSCLAHALDDFNQARSSSSSSLLSLDQLQLQLRSMDTHVEYYALQPAMERMTQAARQALARLVLQQQLLLQLQIHEQSPPKAFPGSFAIGSTTQPRLNRTAVVEFCGLCQAVVLLGPVQEFLASQGQYNDPPQDGLKLYGTPVLVSRNNNKKLIVPQERLQHIQTLFFHALGYPDADRANQQLSSVIEGDTELQQLFLDTMTQLRAVLLHATEQMQEHELNDFEQGGVTRVISTSYSEHTHNNENEARTVPMTFDMGRSDDGVPMMATTAMMAMTRQTAALEQTLLAQLLQMDSCERSSLLEQARMAQEDLAKALSELTTGPERVEYLTTSLSTETRQLLLMQRIWQGLLDRNQGKPPKMASTRDRDY